jgi:LacI family transcriptional regulator
VSTLREIATRLSTSPATVSRALNGKTGVSEELRQRVFEVASELNFSPNAVAKGLVSSKTFAVGFVIKRFLIGSDNPFYDQIMHGVEQELEQHGYHVVATTIDDSQFEHSKLPPGLDKRRLDGLFIAGCELSPRVMATLLSQKLPTILVANALPHSRTDAVTSDNREGGYQATKHFIEHGHKHVAFLCGPREWSPVLERLQGYEDAIRENGLKPLITQMAGLEVSQGYEALRDTLEQHPEVTAVFASSDPVAIGAMRAAKDRGLNIPNDLAIIGFDNIPWTQNLDVPLTTVNIHKAQLGVQAGRRMLELLENPLLPPVTVRIANELLIRSSCGCNTTKK